MLSPMLPSSRGLRRLRMIELTSQEETLFIDLIKAGYGKGVIFKMDHKTLQKLMEELTYVQRPVSNTIKGTIIVT